MVSMSSSGFGLGHLNVVSEGARLPPPTDSTQYGFEEAKADNLAAAALEC
jgi:hypothetical protein